MGMLSSVGLTNLKFPWLLIIVISILGISISLAQVAPGPPSAGGGGTGGPGVAGGYITGCWDFYTNESCLNENDSYTCVWHQDIRSGGPSGWCEKTTWKDCWQYNTNTSCIDTGCNWEGYGYCYQKNCWDFQDQSSCIQANTLYNLSCRWETSGTATTTDDYCYEVGCWSYDTNETCNAAPNCNWTTEQDWGWCEDLGCWSYDTETKCNTQTNCEWSGGSYCRYKSCGDYTTSEDCLNSTFNCLWDNQSKYCYELGCGDFNETTCENNTYNLTCRWNSNYSYCYEPSCYDYTTQSDCESTSDNLDCEWDSYWSECHEKGCWSYNNQTSCSSTSGCSWRSSGWCEQVDCWSFNTSATCENNNYGLICSWENQSHCEGPPEYSCGDYNNNETACEAATGCTWKLGWCNKPGCWNFNTQESCNNESDNYDCLWNEQPHCEGPPEYSCGSYDNNETTCNATEGCTWKLGWCGQLDCWNFNQNESVCLNESANYNLTCIWDNQSKDCYMKGCWDYSNETECTNLSLHPKLNCSWDNQSKYCYEPGCWDYKDNSTCVANGCRWQEGGGWCEEDVSSNVGGDVDCWSLDNSASCLNYTYCTWEVWGNCEDKNACWKQDTQTDCEALTTTNKCVWDSTYNYCYKKGCWEYTTETGCTGVTGCEWDNSSNTCYEKGCWSYNNPDSCSNINDSLNCKWNTYYTCKDTSTNCWDFHNQSACESNNCTWNPSSWCESINENGTDCWMWDNNESACNNQTNCQWKDQGWCEQPGPWQYTAEASCKSAGYSWKNEGGWCNEPSDLQCWTWNNDSATCENKTGCRWDGYNCVRKECWDFWDEASCNNATDLGCAWQNQSSSGWCEQLDCWSFYNQSSCLAHSNDTQCTWATFGWCEQKNCFMLENESSCTNTSDTLDCDWQSSGWCEQNYTCTLCFDNIYGCPGDLDNQSCINHAPWCEWNSSANNGTGACQVNQTACNSTVQDNCDNCGNFDELNCTAPSCNWNPGGQCENEFGYWNVDCGQYWDNQSACENTTGCKWRTGWCNEKGCWSYNDNNTCENSTLHQNLNCTWREDPQNPSGGWCEEKGCWNYWNQTECEAHTSDMGCTWHEDSWSPGGGWCEEPGCWSYKTEETCNAAVVKGTNCTWHEDNFGGWCEMGGCMAYNNESACTNASEDCVWRTESHCEQARCWMWDSWNGGNETLCVNKGSEYNLSCEWQNGTCVEAFAGCDIYTTKEDCFNAVENGMFCWWDEASKTCKNPGEVAGGSDWMDQMAGEKQNPGCWIFDYEMEYCNDNYVDVCVNVSGKCKGKSADVEITCGNIKDSTLCEDIPVLATCCEWKNNKCVSNPETTKCYSDLKPPPEGANFCEDYVAYTDQSTCEEIAGSPWFMPCEWDNSTSHCVFRSEDKFGGKKKGCDAITNKKDCEYAGCEWKTDFYCQNTTAVPFGYCVQKVGKGAKSCDAACWACEFQPNGSSWNNVSAAQQACENSALGYCNFTAFTNQDSEGRWGKCDVPKDVKYIGDCNSDCKACEKKKDPQTACQESNANCKWVEDTTGTTTIGGWCYPKSEKSCAEDCFRCYDEKDCVNFGGGSKNSCVWDSSTGICKPKNFDKEICFDQIDNDGDGRIDCDDGDCFSDPFCGSGMISNCWQYNTKEKCKAAANESNCVWIKDPWENKEWCGMKGENCFLWDGNNSGCNAQPMCEWFQDPKGGFCEIRDSLVKDCFKKTSQGSCVLDPDCYWEFDSDSSTGGYCKPKVHKCETKTTQTDCESGEWSNRCEWIIDVDTGVGECEPICFSKNLKTDVSCNANPNCQWMTGFCDPKSDLGLKMEDCWKYDSDPSLCNNMSGCVYHQEMEGGFCDINFTLNDQVCMNLNYDQCNNNGNCSWKGDPIDGWCELKIFEECGWHQNQSSCENANISCAWVNDSFCDGPPEFGCWNYNDNESACQATQGCEWRGPRCEPICFSLNQSSCGSESVCMWRGGFCESKMAKTMFQGMDEAPVDLGTDEDDGCGPQNSITQEELDICGFGVKEMKDNYGFGAGVTSLENAAVCKGKRITKQTPQGPQDVTDSGVGTNTTKFYLYLDTDGSETGGCWLWNDPDQEGYEFFFKYEVSIKDGEVKETRSAYRCKDGDWVIADIKLSGWRNLMCSEIGGFMIAIDKDDLNKYNDLFKPGETMRVYIATAGKKRTEVNPVDTAGPAYYTPGTVDFKFEDCLTPDVDMDGDGFLSQNDPDCAMFFKKGGFVKHEDCFETGIDEDEDGLVDCQDPDCKYDKACEGKINVTNDTTAPQLIWSEVREYPDAAFIKYDTDEPANGTILFYYNDSSCSSNYTSIKDPALLDSKTKNNYKNWHDGPIDNFAENPQKLNNSLLNGTTYYYKIKICDSSGNCAFSACLNFTTAASDSKADCPDCWVVVPGEMGACGKATKRVYYKNTTDIKLLSENEIAVEILNVKGSSFEAPNVTMSNIKTTEGEAAGYVGMDSDDFDDLRGKIGSYTDINCTIKVPKGNGGTCDKLWHCPDPEGGTIDISKCESYVDGEEGVTFVEETSEYCVWIVPCDFSIWMSNPGTTGGNEQEQSSSGGPGGGVSGYVPPKEKPKNATKKLSLVPGVGLRNNTKLQSALEKVLGKGKMSRQAIDNLLRLSASIIADLEATRNFKIEQNKSKLELRVKYKGKKKARNFIIYDKIPKSFANSTDLISVIAPGANIEIVNKDPEYAFVYPEVSEGQELSVTYEVSGEKDSSVINETSIEFYAENLEEPVIVEEEQPKENKTEEKKPPMALPTEQPNYIPIFLGVLVIALIVGIGYYFEIYKKKK